LILLLASFVRLATAIFSWGYIGVIVEAGDLRKIRRYYSLFNLFLLSLLAIPIFSHVAIVWIAVELTTLLSVFLVSFESTPEALEAAWKYVVLNGMGAPLALLGILLLYWDLSLSSPAAFTWAGLIAASPKFSPALLRTAFLFIFGGFGIKVALVPFHTWIPEAHSQAPSPICAILSGIETTAVLSCIIRLLPMFINGAASYASMWFIIFGLISTGVAAFLMLQTKDYKRLFAFSTVEHMGIILVGAGLGSFSAHSGPCCRLSPIRSPNPFASFRPAPPCWRREPRALPPFEALFAYRPRLAFS
jgi:hydrogenase-4 component F